jgi:hypothetical protein
MSLKFFFLNNNAPKIGKEAQAKWVTGRLFEKRDYRFSDETLLGTSVICKDRTFLLQNL